MGHDISNLTDWNDLRAAQLEITRWADGTFPARSPYKALTKLVMHEVPEMLRHVEENGTETVGPELADCLILLFDLATLWEVNIPEALKQKMAINYQREWVKNEESGLYQHKTETYED